MLLTSRFNALLALSQLSLAVVVQPPVLVGFSPGPGSNCNAGFICNEDSFQYLACTDAINQFQDTTWYTKATTCSDQGEEYIGWCNAQFSCDNNVYIMGLTGSKLKEL